jgi:excisionase family DNA binding protein
MREVLTSSEAAAYLRMSEQTLYRKIKKGIIYVRQDCPRGHFRITKSALDAYLRGELPSSTTQAVSHRRIV